MELDCGASHRRQRRRLRHECNRTESGLSARCDECGDNGGRGEWAKVWKRQRKKTQTINIKQLFPIPCSASATEVKQFFTHGLDSGRYFVCGGNKYSLGLTHFLKLILIRSNRFGCSIFYRILLLKSIPLRIEPSRRQFFCLLWDFLTSSSTNDTGTVEGLDTPASEWTRSTLGTFCARLWPTQRSIEPINSYRVLITDKLLVNK